ncbi:hypothetical protein ABFS82_01G105800 [Erythranthe guttata]|uniref:probable receptor-like protein kinase At4g10390 n=1 Tax=Erythranthe guttata TaxID=4155 RepID=UPI00064D91B3|nr:PREDICTED: probable receptor-like protein kinase At4g10390 [Erythranthe guttata]|eukprot:XP_012858935.1 PREDICTED: probable receptor-like protein kinase At4g10390 [Erythranthe guttata]
MGFMKFVKFLRLKLSSCKRVGGKRVAAFDIGDDDDDVEDYTLKSNSIFSWEEIQKLTMNLSMVIGYGGFSTVYLAHLPDSTTAAVKIQCSSERLNQAHKLELEILQHLQHPNIVKIIGHCHDREEGILVLEHAPNGNLQEKLHGSSKNNNIHLSWKKRISIAFQLAKAIEYLHKHPTLQIIHGDIKSSNILLDQNLNCKLCDFGSSKMGFSSLVLNPNSNSFIRRNRVTMVGSPGYTDPHYLRTGLASKENDIYSFGVVILELITGIQAFNPSTGERLTVRAERVLNNVSKAVEIVDPRLEGDVDFEEVKAMAAISAMCFSDSPVHRPSASDILNIMANKISSISS